MSWEDALKGVPPSSTSNSPLLIMHFLPLCPPVQLNCLCGCYVWVSPISWSPNTDPHLPCNPTHPTHPPHPPALSWSIWETYGLHSTSNLRFTWAGRGTWCCWGQFLLVSGLQAPETQQLPSPLLCPGPQGMS